MPKSNTTAEPVVNATPEQVSVTPEAEVRHVDPVIAEAKTAAPAESVLLTPEAKQAQADKIVMKATYTSLGMGFIPVPVVDIIAVSGFQMKMIAELSELHNVKFSEHVARNVITALIGSMGPVIVGRLAARTLLKFIPGVGTAIATLWMQGIIDGAATYAIGRVFQRHFEQGGTFFDFDLKKAKEYFLIKFKEGKTIVAKSVGNATTAAANTFRSKDKPETTATVVEVVPA